MTDKPKRKRARGKRVGVKLMEDTYQPTALKTFSKVRSMAQVRLKARRQSVAAHVEEELDFQDVRARLARMVNVAHAKKAMATGLLKEAGAHRRKAIAVSQTLQILPIDQDPYDDDTLEANLTSQETFGVKDSSYGNDHNNGEDDWSMDMREAVDAAMWLHKEHLDLIEVNYWRGHFQTEIAKCITMEDCAEMIDTATAKAAELMVAIQEGDGDDDEADGAAQSP